MPGSTERTSISLLEIHGVYSTFLVLVALIIGIVALVLRRQKFSMFSACTILGIALAGLGATFWNLWDIHSMHVFHYGGAHDPYQYLANLGLACARAGVVLPACGGAMILVGLSFLFSRPDPKEPPDRSKDN